MSKIKEMRAVFDALNELIRGNEGREEALVEEVERLRLFVEQLKEDGKRMSVRLDKAQAEKLDERHKLLGKLAPKLERLERLELFVEAAINDFPQLETILDEEDLPERCKAVKP